METIDETAITNHAPLPNQGIAEHESLTQSTDDCRKDTVNRHGDQVRWAAAFEVSILNGEEEEGFVAAVEDLGNINWPADAAARVGLPSHLPRPRSEGKSAGIESLVSQEH